MRCARCAGEMVGNGARLEAAPPEAARKFIHKSGGASGGAASCRAVEGPWPRPTRMSGRSAALGGLRFSAVSRTFSRHKVARKRDPPGAIPTGTRFCASASAWRAQRARLEAAPPEAARNCIHKSGGASGGAASCRAVEGPWARPTRMFGRSATLGRVAFSCSFPEAFLPQGRAEARPSRCAPHGGRASARPRGLRAPEGAPAASCHLSLFTCHWRARRARRAYGSGAFRPMWRSGSL
jgi:hypothetical protein